MYILKRNSVYILILTLIIGFIPLKSFGHNNIDFIDVRIDIKPVSQEIELSSPLGFNLYNKGNLRSEIMDISHSKISIRVNEEKSIDIFDGNGDLVDTIPGDGSLLIGSREMSNSIVQVNDKKYRGYIFFLIKNENINIINQVHMEEYLYGVVPREIPASSQGEALKAQSVVARSFAYTNLNKHINDGYNLCNTTHCQVYGGLDSEHPNTNQAIKDTYGDYVSYNGDIISTPYHSNSGGHTEDSALVWGGSLPYLLGVEDRYSNDSPNSSWTMNVTPREIQNKFASVGIDIGQILDIEIVEASQSNRVIEIKIIGSKKEEIMTGERFRNILGDSYLKSTLFTIDKEGGQSSNKVYVIDGSGNLSKEVDLKSISMVHGKESIGKNTNKTIGLIGKDKSINMDTSSITSANNFLINGKGYGHGVGMSQYGAMEMAKQGYSYVDIIKHYYKGVEIINFGK